MVGLGLIVAAVAEGAGPRAWMREQLAAAPEPVFERILVARLAGSRSVVPLDRARRTVLVAVMNADDVQHPSLHLLSIDGGSRRVEHALADQPLCAAALTRSGLRLAHGRLGADGRCVIEVVEVATGAQVETFDARVRVSDPVAHLPDNTVWYGDHDLLYVAVGATPQEPATVLVHRIGTVGPDPNLATIGEPGARVALQQLGNYVLVTTFVSVGDEERSTIDRVDLTPPGGWVRLANLDRRDTVLGTVDDGFLVARRSAGHSTIGRLDPAGVSFEPQTVLAGMFGVIAGGELYFRTADPGLVLHHYGRSGERQEELPVPPHHYPTQMLGDPHDVELVYGSWWPWSGGLVHTFDRTTGVARTLTDPALPFPPLGFRNERIAGHTVSVGWSGDEAGGRSVALVCHGDASLFEGAAAGQAWGWWLERGGSIAALRAPTGSKVCSGTALAEVAGALLEDGRARPGGVLVMGSGGTFEAVRSAPERFGGAVVLGSGPVTGKLPALPPIRWELAVDAAELDVRRARSVSEHSARFVLARREADERWAEVWGARLAFAAEVAEMSADR